MFLHVLQILADPGLFTTAKLKRKYAILSIVGTFMAKD